MNSLANKVINGDSRVIARLMRLIESEDKTASACLNRLLPHTGKSHVIGITGLPGAGKSSIIDKLIDFYRSQGKSVGVIAIDPSSPFSGGSLLGDRVRMQNHATDNEVFIKSLPTKGYKGGISKAASRMITVLDAAGYDTVIVETAGVGQTEVEVKDLVHTTVVVLVGGLGDYIQIIKAGIIEIADIFVINKADKNSSAQELKLDLESLMAMNGTSKGFTPLICLTEAINGTGIDALAEAIASHRSYLDSTGTFVTYFDKKARADLEQMILEYISCLAEQKLRDAEIFGPEYPLFVDPRKAAEKIIKSMCLSIKGE